MMADLRRVRVTFEGPVVATGPESRLFYVGTGYLDEAVDWEDLPEPEPEPEPEWSAGAVVTWTTDAGAGRTRVAVRTAGGWWINPATPMPPSLWTAQHITSLWEQGKLTVRYDGTGGAT